LKGHDSQNSAGIDRESNRSTNAEDKGVNPNFAASTSLGQEAPVFLNTRFHQYNNQQIDSFGGKEEIISQPQI
jgi:hypothetical protein